MYMHIHIGHLYWSWQLTYTHIRTCIIIVSNLLFLKYMCIQSVLPGWKDTKSIVASLRQNNYSVDDCINVYLTINDDG